MLDLYVLCLGSFGDLTDVVMYLCSVLSVFIKAVLEFGFISICLRFY